MRKLGNLHLSPEQLARMIYDHIIEHRMHSAVLIGESDRFDDLFFHRGVSPATMVWYGEVIKLNGLGIPLPPPDDMGA